MVVPRELAVGETLRDRMRPGAWAPAFASHVLSVDGRGGVRTEARATPGRVSDR